MKNKVIVIELDNVICTVEKDLQLCIPKFNVLYSLDRLRTDNNYIIINTAREMKHVKTTLEWLRLHKIPYDHIQFGKPQAQIYVGDKGYKFSDWKTLMKDIYSVDISRDQVNMLDRYERRLRLNIGEADFDYDIQKKIIKAMDKARKELG